MANDAFKPNVRGFFYEARLPDRGIYDRRKPDEIGLIAAGLRRRYGALVEPLDENSMTIRIPSQTEEGAEMPPNMRAYLSRTGLMVNKLRRVAMDMMIDDLLRLELEARKRRTTILTIGVDRAGECCEIRYTPLRQRYGAISRTPRGVQSPPQQG